MSVWVSLQIDKEGEAAQSVLEQVRERLQGLPVFVHPWVVQGAAHEYLWRCPECGDEALWTMSACEESGTPYCGACEVDMELVQR